jgi:hypothetical protein
MSIAAFNPNIGQTIQTSVAGVSVDEAFLAHFNINAALAVAASTTGIHAAVADNGSQQAVTTGINNPGTPRNVTATAGGTATDIKAVQVIISGTNYADEAITETLPAFTTDTAGTVQGNKAFKTITGITLPAHDGTGANTAIGFGNKLGLPFKLPHNTVDDAYLDGVRETVAPTVSTSVTAIDGNTITLASPLAGKDVDIYLKV